MLDLLDDTTPQPINAFEGEYAFLSNFYLTKMTYNNVTFPSSEHAYQAQKSSNSRIHKIFAKLETPAEAKTLGRALRVREDWEDMKLLIMFNIVKVKFDSNPIIKAKLLATGDRELIEGNSWGDKFWGVCDGEGDNNLGKILMKLRAGYRAGIY